MLVEEMLAWIDGADINTFIQTPRVEFGTEQVIDIGGGINDTVQTFWDQARGWSCRRIGRIFDDRTISRRSVVGSSPYPERFGKLLGWTIIHGLPGPMWLAPYVLDYMFGIESDEEKEVVGIVHNSLHEVLNWLKGKADDLLKDTDIPESLLAYAEEIDIGREQLREFKGGDFRRLIITHELYMCRSGNLAGLRRGMDVNLDGESLCEVCIY